MAHGLQPIRRKRQQECERKKENRVNGIECRGETWERKSGQEVNKSEHEERKRDGGRDRERKTGRGRGSPNNKMKKK